MRSLSTSCATILVLFLTTSTQATVITWAASYEFSGATPPEGAAPWLTATIDDGGSAGSVDFYLEATNLIDNEYVKVWLFNLDPALDPNLLIFSTPIKTGTFTDPVISTGVDAFMANGDGDFDIEFAFSQADGGVRRFGVAEAVEYTITGIPTLTASSFDFLSAQDGGDGSFPMAAHVGGIGPTNDDSGWVSIPEPATLTMLAVGALALLRRKRE